jgi:signal transduction histidine kinase
MLRRDQRTAGELVAWLRTRCLDLATGALKVSFEVDVDDARVVPGEVGMHVVHVVLEAVRNASRHALAKSVAVRVGLRGEVVVSVRDDGRGLPEGALEATAGGLANLRARASSLGGSLEVGSDAQGTTVTLRCPWPVTPTSADMR